DDNPAVASAYAALHDQDRHRYIAQDMIDSRPQEVVADAVEAGDAHDHETALPLCRQLSEHFRRGTPRENQLRAFGGIGKIGAETGPLSLRNLTLSALDHVRDDEVRAPLTGELQRPVERAVRAAAEVARQQDFRHGDHLNS